MGVTWAPVVFLVLLLAAAAAPQHEGVGARPAEDDLLLQYVPIGEELQESLPLLLGLCPLLLSGKLDVL